MKVCLINNLYGDNAVGGAEKVVQARALEYKKKRDQIVVITTKADKSSKTEKNNENGLVVYRVYIPNIFYYKDLNKHGFVLKLIWHLIDVFNKPKVIEQILAEEKPDIVETHNLMGVGYKVIRNKEKGVKKYKWIHFLHDVQLVESSGVLAWNHEVDNLWQKIYSWVMRRKFGNVDEVISPSEFLRGFYMERGFFENSEWVIDNHPVPRCESGSTPPSKGGDKNKFLFVGLLVEHKGIHILIQAWDRVGTGRDLSTHKELHIVGNGILRNEVEKWASDKTNVKVYGRLEGDELENIYKKCDTLIFPSICIENNPTVIHEAHEYGLRVIASDTGGVSEIISEDDVLVKPGNVEELIDSI